MRIFTDNIGEDRPRARASRRSRDSAGRRGGALVVFLICGALLNILVAALCLCYAPTGQTAGGLVGISATDGIGHPLHALARKPANHFEGLGVLIVGIEYFWVLPPTPPQLDLAQLSAVEIDTIRAGWPLTSLDTSDYDMSGATSYAAFARLASASGDRPSTFNLGLTRLGAKHRPIPTRIVPIGFAFNSVLYAVLIGAVARFGTAQRRGHRLRSGRCPDCAYPLTGGPICPECGRTTQQAVAASTSWANSNSAPSAFGIASHAAVAHCIACPVPTVRNPR